MWSVLVFMVGGPVLNLMAVPLEALGVLPSLFVEWLEVVVTAAQGVLAVEALGLFAATRLGLFSQEYRLEVSAFSLVFDGQRIEASQIAGCRLQDDEILLALTCGDVRIPVSDLEPAERRWLCAQLGQVSARWVQRVGAVPESLRRLRAQAPAQPARVGDR